MSRKVKCLCYHPYVIALFTSPGVSLHIPDLTEQWGKFVVVHSPGCEHLCVVVVECSQLRQAAQETSKVLRLLWMLQDTQLPQQVQHGLLKSLNSLLILHIRPIWRGVERTVVIHKPFEDQTFWNINPPLLIVIPKYLWIIES